MRLLDLVDLKNLNEDYKIHKNKNRAERLFFYGKNTKDILLLSLSVYNTINLYRKSFI